MLRARVVTAAAPSSCLLVECVSRVARRVTLRARVVAAAAPSSCLLVLAARIRPAVH